MLTAVVKPACQGLKHVKMKRPSLDLLLQYPFGKPRPADSGAVLSPLLELVESTRSQGEELFGESADNITAVVVACEVTLPS